MPTRFTLAVLMLCTGPLSLWTAPVTSADGTLVVGVFPRRPAIQTETMFAPLVTQLEKSLQRPVRLEVPPDFAAFWAAIQDNRYQLLHYNAYHYVRAHKEFQHRVIAMNEEFGSSRIQAAIWRRHDSPTRTPADLIHKKIAFGGGRDAMVSYIMAADLLQQAGLAPQDYITQFTINPTHALMAVYYHQSSAAGLNIGADKQPALQAQLDFEQLSPLLISEAVALHPWAVNASVGHELALKITTTLQQLERSDEGQRALQQAGLTRLVPASDSDYDPHRRIIARVLGEQY